MRFPDLPAAVGALKIELERTPGQGWLVRYGDFWEDHLTIDEALGSVASIMFTGRGMFLKNPIEHFLWDSHYNPGPPQLPEKAGAP